MRWYSIQSQMYPLYVVFLVVLAIQPVGMYHIGFQLEITVHFIA